MMKCIMFIYLLVCLLWHHQWAYSSGGFCFCFLFLWPHLEHMEVPRLGDELELQPAYTTVMAMWDPSCICDLHCSLQHGLQQHQILKPTE